MEFLRRLTRRWWVMLLLGVVVGLGAGLPLGGKVMPGGDQLAGYAGWTGMVNGYWISPGAFLPGVDLRWANLSGADLSGAIFHNTTMPDGTIRSD